MRMEDDAHGDDGGSLLPVNPEASPLGGNLEDTGTQFSFPEEVIKISEGGLKIDRNSFYLEFVNELRFQNAFRLCQFDSLLTNPSKTEVCGGYYFNCLQLRADTLADPTQTERMAQVERNAERVAQNILTSARSFFAPQNSIVSATTANNQNLCKNIEVYLRAISSSKSKRSVRLNRERLAQLWLKVVEATSQTSPPTFCLEDFVLVAAKLADSSKLKKDERATIIEEIKQKAAESQSWKDIIEYIEEVDANSESSGRYEYNGLLSFLKTLMEESPEMLTSSLVAILKEPLPKTEISRYLCCTTSSHSKFTRDKHRISSRGRAESSFRTLLVIRNVFHSAQLYPGLRAADCVWFSEKKRAGRLAQALQDLSESALVCQFGPVEKSRRIRNGTSEKRIIATEFGVLLDGKTPIVDTFLVNLSLCVQEGFCAFQQLLAECKRSRDSGGLLQWPIDLSKKLADGKACADQWLDRVRQIFKEFIPEKEFPTPYDEFTLTCIFPTSIKKFKEDGSSLCPFALKVERFTDSYRVIMRIQNEHSQHHCDVNEILSQKPNNSVSGAKALKMFGAYSSGPTLDALRKDELAGKLTALGNQLKSTEQAANADMLEAIDSVTEWISNVLKHCSADPNLVPPPNLFSSRTIKTKSRDAEAKHLEEA